MERQGSAPARARCYANHYVNLLGRRWKESAPVLAYGAMAEMSLHEGLPTGSPTGLNGCFKRMVKRVTVCAGCRRGRAPGAAPVFVDRIYGLTTT